MVSPIERETNPSTLIQPFLEAAKGAPEASVRAIVTKVLSHSDLFAGYNELLQVIANPSNDIRNTLRLFSYGVWKDYVQNQAQLLPLNDSQAYKLKQLTVLSLLPHSKVSLPYSTVREALEMEDVEPILISLLYVGAIGGQLCQKTQALYWTECRLSRDVPDVKSLLEQVRYWRTMTGKAQEALAQQANYTENVKEHDKQYWKQYELSTSMTSADALLEVAASGLAGHGAVSLRRQKRSRGGLTNSGSSHFQV
ncbi:COP9 signalosome complex subunit 7 [Fistulifera solaris]|uniref:COP9 signalosome complex subunit 7 n=1 Tax=Fistulifera solaris TaxID=1519565 RepID=A0A1Z5KN85_FISSO|nr:COP9 signalosome complex subunit 7 [Fistulifera solaris]|eukprot:GAX27471.1 COP9 signalosome complex subunit 7 [Fistulifera solaris]